MYLLDTNIVSELRKAKAVKCDANVIAWANSVNPSSLFISSITVLELETGVLQIERKDKEQGKLLRHWLEQQVYPTFENKTLPIDAVVARCCAELHVPDRRSDRDALIAATAIVHGMMVVTRNTVDFENTGARLLNPFSIT